MEMTNFEAPHPGEFILEELEARGLQQVDLAFTLGVPASAVNAIVSGRRGISADMAKALGEAFDVPAEFFWNLQKAHELSQAKQPSPRVSKMSKLVMSNVFPIREMISRGWFVDSDADVMEAQVARFFRASTILDVPHMAHAARKTRYDETPPVQLAWLFRVKQIAESLIVCPYSESKLRASLAQMSTMLLSPEEVRHVPRILADCGVRFVAVESLTGARISGVCFWLDGNKPVIGMSLNRDRNDSFWFTLRHEIEHVLCGDGKDVEIIDSDDQSDEQAKMECEIRADAAAKEFCVPQKDLANFIDRVSPYFAENRIRLFAERIGVHPGLVVGQLQTRLDRHDFLTKVPAKIRQHIVPNAHHDGWGQTYPISI